MSGAAQHIEWYLARDGQQYGPVKDAELEKILELGHLREQDLVWRAGFAEWRPAKDVFPNVFASNAGTPPPPPTERTGPATQPPAGASSPSGAGPMRHQQPNTGPSGQDGARIAPSGGRSGPAGRHGGPGQGGGEPTYGAGSAQRPGADPAGRTPYGHPGTRSPQAGQHGAQSGVRVGHGQHGQDGANIAPHDRRRVIESAGVEAQLEQARMRERPSQEQVRWGDEATAHPGSAMPDDGGRRSHGPKRGVRRPEGYGADIDDFAEMPPRRRSSVAKVLWSLVLAAVIGLASAGGWMAYTNSGAAERLLAQFTGSIGGGSGKPEVVEAPKDPARVAANIRPNDRPGPAATRPTAQQPANPTTPSAATVEPTKPQSEQAPQLLTTPLWATFKAGFPHWAKKLDDRAQAMKSAGASEDEIGNVVIRAMVQLRRQNAAVALSAPPENLQTVATAFVANLKFLRKTSIDACYGFIAEGDLSKQVLPLMLDPARMGPLHRQSIAVMRAINAGRSSKIAYASPKKEDFEALSSELTKRGWSRDDLQLFSDPTALSKAPHEQVCRLVTEWFETQLQMPDGEQKMRLLTASLSPVVAG